jgi:hypothetical protein
MKDILFVNTRPNLFFAITGSGMITALNYFWRFPANGAMLLASAQFCILHPVEKQEVVEKMKELLNDRYKYKECIGDKGKQSSFFYRIMTFLHTHTHTHV